MDITEELINEATEIIKMHKERCDTFETTLLQRKLHIGYARTRRLLDKLEECGIVRQIYEPKYRIEILI